MKFRFVWDFSGLFSNRFKLRSSHEHRYHCKVWLCPQRVLEALRNQKKFIRTMRRVCLLRWIIHESFWPQMKKLQNANGRFCVSGRLHWSGEVHQWRRMFWFVKILLFKIILHENFPFGSSFEKAWLKGRLLLHFNLQYIYIYLQWKTRGYILNTNKQLWSWTHKRVIKSRGL